MLQRTQCISPFQADSNLCLCRFIYQIFGKPYIILAKIKKSEDNLNIENQFPRAYGFCYRLKIILSF